MRSKARLAALIVSLAAVACIWGASLRKPAPVGDLQPVPVARSGARAFELGTSSGPNGALAWFEAQPDLDPAGNISATAFISWGQAMLRVGDVVLTSDDSAGFVWIDSDTVLVRGQYLARHGDGTVATLDTGCQGCQAYAVSPDHKRVAYSGDLDSQRKGVSILNLSSLKASAVWQSNAEDWGSMVADGGMSVFWLNNETVLVGDAYRGHPAIWAINPDSLEVSVWRDHAFTPNGSSDGKLVSFVSCDGFGINATEPPKTVLLDRSTGVSLEISPCRVIWDDSASSQRLALIGERDVTLARFIGGQLVIDGRSDVAGVPRLVHFDGDALGFDEVIVGERVTEARRKTLPYSPR